MGLSKSSLNWGMRTVIVAVSGYGFAADTISQTPPHTNPLPAEVPQAVIVSPPPLMPPLSPPQTSPAPMSDASLSEIAMPPLHTRAPAPVYGFVPATPYRIIAGPAAIEQRKLQTAAVPTAMQLEVTTPPRFAYGWFGAADRQHWQRSFGYNRRYTQWSTRPLK